MSLPVWHATDGSVDAIALSARISVLPYSDNDADRVPHVVFEPSQDEPMASLGPDEFAAVIMQIRAHCDRLDSVHAQLIDARMEWETNQ